MHCRWRPNGTGPDISVRVTYFVVSDDFTGRKIDGVPFGVIRQRARSDEKYPDLGQMLTWQLLWQWTPILVEEANGGADCNVTCIPVSWRSGWCRHLPHAMQVPEV